MLDTIDLLIPANQLHFTTGAWDLHSKTPQYEKFVKNPSKKDLEKWDYLPRITRYSRNGLVKDKKVRIEFSIPKLLFYNNLDEIQQKDFPLVINALKSRLAVMGIAVEKSTLENAPVSTIHFSKNIKLEDGYTVSYIISELNKINLTKHLDFTRARFINDGESLCAHSSSYEFVVYDKIADLRKSLKRAIDRDNTEYQQSLFANIEDKRLEILRFEIRLGNRQKMNKVFKGLGYKENLCFKEIFSEDLSKKVISSFWEKLIKERSIGIFSLSFNIKDALRTIFLSGSKPKQAIYLIGLLTLAKEDGGLRSFRSTLPKNLNGRAWFRLIADLKMANTTIIQNKVKSWVAQIDQKLADFEPYKQERLSTPLVKNCKV